MRLAVFASGGGSNLQAILDCGDFNVVLVVSNTPRAGALERARRAGADTAVIDPAGFPGEAAYVAALMAALDDREVDAIALAGYLRKIPPAVVAAYRGSMVNIHPALLPAFGGKGLYGRRVHEAVIRAGVRESGATVHFVDEEYDTGPILLQDSVPVCARPPARPTALRFRACGRDCTRDRCCSGARARDTGPRCPPPATGGSRRRG